MESYVMFGLVIMSFILLAIFVNYIFNIKACIIDDVNKKYYEALRDFIDTERRQYTEIYEEIVKLNKKIEKLIKEIK